MKHIGLLLIALLLSMGSIGCLVTTGRPARTVVVHDHGRPERTVVVHDHDDNRKRHFKHKRHGDDDDQGEDHDD